MKHSLVPFLLLFAIGLLWQVQSSDAFNPQLPPRQSPNAEFRLCAASNRNREADDENSRRSKGGQKREQAWNKRIEELEKYKKEFGTVNVSFTHAERKDEWKGLAEWAVTVRRVQGRLSQEQRDQLTSMGFTFKGAKEEKEDQRWAEMFDRLEQYNITHGDNRVPINYTLDRALGRWVRRQREWKMQGILKPERIEKLNSIKFVWQLKDYFRALTPKEEEIWFENLANLTKFHEENGHYWPSRSSSNTTIHKLGIWVSNQRSNKKRGILDEYREQELERIGFPWYDTENKESEWFAKFDKVKEVVKQRKRDGLDGSAFTVSVLGRKQYNWLYRQQMLYLKGDFDPKRKSLLDSIGFEWPPEENE